MAGKLESEASYAEGPEGVSFLQSNDTLINGLLDTTLTVKKGGKVSQRTEGLI